MQVKNKNQFNNGSSLPNHPKRSSKGSSFDRLKIVLDFKFNQHKYKLSTALETDFFRQRRSAEFYIKVQNQFKAVVMSHPWCVLIIHHLSMIKQKSSSFSLIGRHAFSFSNNRYFRVKFSVYRYWKVERDRVVSHGLYKTEGFIVIKVWKPNRIVLRLAFIYNLYSLNLCHWLTAMIRTIRISNSLKKPSSSHL